mmetsp:Transcript_46077/g.82270  ORF Transcript_46077/g.82270 Transcript_46077/m.82270 type:complete len:355 (+) Transcript_46077:715-1779(+)
MCGSVWQARGRTSSLRAPNRAGHGPERCIKPGPPAPYSFVGCWMRQSSSETPLCTEGHNACVVLACSQRLHNLQCLFIGRLQLLGMLFKQCLNRVQCIGKHVQGRQERQPNVVSVRHVETAAGCNEDAVLLHQVQGKNLVVKVRQVDLHERIHGTLRLAEGHVLRVGYFVDDHLARLIEATPWGHQGIDALNPFDGGFDAILAWDVAAQPQPTQHVEGIQIPFRMRSVSGAQQPTHTEATRPIHLRESPKRAAEGVLDDAGHVRHAVAVEDHRIIDLVSKHHHPTEGVLLSHVCNVLKQLPGVQDPRRIVWVDDNHRPGAGGDLGTDILNQRDEAILGQAVVVHRHPPVHGDCS